MLIHVLNCWNLWSYLCSRNENWFWIDSCGLCSEFVFQFSHLSSSNESQDRGLPPGTEHIYLNSEAVKKHIYHSLFGFYNSLLHIWPKNTTCRFLNTFTTISSGFQRNLPLKVRSFAVGGQIQERQKREVAIMFTKNW